MFAALGRFVVAHPWRVIAAWVVVAAALIGFAPTLADITTTDQTAFLPDRYESARAQKLADSAFPRATGASAVIVVERRDGEPLTATDTAAVTAAAQALQARQLPQVRSVQTSPQSVSEDSRVQLIQVAFNGTTENEDVQRAVPDLRAAVSAATAGTQLRAGLTGEAAVAVDTMDKFATAEQVVGIATIALIIVLMLLMFRSPLAAALPIAAVALVMTVSNSVIAITG
jgi:putative drug exporter of the RND superfamily